MNQYRWDHKENKWNLSDFKMARDEETIIQYKQGRPWAVIQTRIEKFWMFRPRLLVVRSDSCIWRQGLATYFSIYIIKQMVILTWRTLKKFGNYENAWIHFINIVPILTLILIFPLMKQNTFLKSFLHLNIVTKYQMNAFNFLWKCS